MFVCHRVCLLDSVAVCVGAFVRERVCLFVRLFVRLCSFEGLCAFGRFVCLFICSFGWCVCVFVYAFV